MTHDANELVTESEVLCEMCEKRPKGRHFQVCDQCWRECNPGQAMT